jgi:Flp pilus assembly secretin CpaC
VEYAEVGRTTVIGLNGLLSKVTSTTATTFDEPTPLRLNNLINDAAQVKSGVDKLFPAAQSIPLAAGAPIDASSAISILAALSKEDVRWRAMSSGITLDITPTVFRDRTAALIDVALTIADPAKTNVSHSEQNPLRTPARISQSTLTTKVNVNTMDLFAISSFNNQTTVTGRRWYVPLVGPVWEGVFGDIPVVGNLFSPIRPPINVQHQSIILTNTLIVPTAMGLTEWYQTSNDSPPLRLRFPGQPFPPF